MRTFGTLPTALAVCLGGCADGAADGRFVGEALFTVGGEIGRYDDEPVAAAATIGLYWLTGVPGSEPATTVTVHFPTDFELAVLAPPDAARTTTYPGTTGRLALGQLIAYQDTDGDALWSSSAEGLLGADISSLILFAPDGLRGASGTWAPGFHRVVSGGCDPRGALVLLPAASADLTVSVSATAVALDSKFGLAVVACPVVPEPENGCWDLATVRTTCAADPAAEVCARCADGIFPTDATPEACDAWRAACVERYVPEDCAAEWKLCLAGGDDAPAPSCDAACCEAARAKCLAAGDLPAACEASYAACVAGR